MSGRWCFFLLSGGGSALVELPLDPRWDWRTCSRCIARWSGCGAPIEGINTVRRHVSAVKGGRLAKAAGARDKNNLGGERCAEAGRESALASRADFAGSDDDER